MKKPRNNQNRKMLGLAIGEGALLIAEVTGSEPPTVSRVAEFVYPAGTPAENLAEMTPAIVALLRENGFTARSAIVGLPAKWLIVKPKELPHSDQATQLSMLRLQADAEFSSELKDLAFDVAGKLGGSDGPSTPVLLAATARKYVAMAQSLCAALGCETSAVTASALALGEQSRSATSGDALVLSMGLGGTELTAQRSGIATSLRRIASTNGLRPSMGELRRALSSLSAANRGRELLLWDATRDVTGEAQPGDAARTASDSAAQIGFSSDAAKMDIDWAALSTQLGLQVRAGSLTTLGATGPASLNADAGRYAAAIALAIAGAADRLPIDFLHTRLAPPKVSRIPRWAMIAGAAAVVLIGLVIWGFHDVHHREQELADAKSQLDNEKTRIDLAGAFVGEVSFARGWHGGNPRYLECLRALTRDMPDDPNTYAMSLTLRETPKPQNTAQVAPGTASTKPAAERTLSGTLYGKASDQNSGHIVLEKLLADPLFTDPKSGGSQDGGRGHDVSFSITFIFHPSQQAP